MFKEFNVEFQDVEMIGGADNLLENTKVTKVVMSGDNKMSSLDSAFKNCSELDNIQGGLDLNGVSNIDNILEGNSLIKNIDLKNVNNENITANNSFPNVEEINIGGELYNKKAIQNVIASKEWTFDNITYSDVVGDNVIIKEVNVVNDNKLVIKDTLEQKAKEIEIKGQTYENLIQGKGEYNLTDTYSATWTESNDSFENMPNVIEISEIYGSTVQDESDLSYIQSVGDLYVDESGEPILDDEGNEQYRLEIEGTNKNIFSKTKSNPYEETEISTGYSGSFYASFDKCTYKLWKDVANGNLTPTISILSPTNKGYIEDKPILQKGKTYTLSGIFKWSEKTQRSLEIGFFDAGMGLFAKQFDLHGRVVGSIEGNFESRTFTLDKDAYGMYIKLPYGGEYAFDLEISNFMIEENTVATDYVSPQSNKTTILLPQQLKGLSDVKDRLFYDYTKNMYVIENKIGDFNNINDLSEAILSVPKIIETKILEKPTLETYSPKTYISANSEVQPSQMSINNKETIFIPKFLYSNKKYTVKFNLAKKGSNTVKVKLGGIEKDAPSALGENSVEITTSQIIDKKELVLNGNGNIVTDVFVIADNMNTGELQEDGTYKIDINTTNNINHYSISIIANNSLAKGDKLYWNKSNRRYEIDRNGVIEVPTVEGNVVDLPRLYQREDTNLTVETGNIKPSEVKIEYLDIN